MTYDKEFHNENQCDKCHKTVGKDKLLKVPFIYLDMNDESHEDLGRGYRQYWVCKECINKC